MQVVWEETDGWVVTIQSEYAQEAEYRLGLLAENQTYTFAIDYPWLWPLIERIYRAELVRTVLLYGCRASEFQPVDEGIARELDEAEAGSISAPPPLGFWRVRLFGALSERDGLLCHCLVRFPLVGEDTGWGEVCNLETRPEHRGRGLAKSVVSAASRAIFEEGREARYRVEQGNAPAIAICESLGYRKLKEVRYYRGSRHPGTPMGHMPPRRKSGSEGGIGNDT